MYVRLSHFFLTSHFFVKLFFCDKVQTGDTRVHGALHSSVIIEYLTNVAILFRFLQIKSYHDGSRKYILCRVCLHVDCISLGRIYGSKTGKDIWQRERLGYMAARQVRIYGS